MIDRKKILDEYQKIEFREWYNLKSTPMFKEKMYYVLEEYWEDRIRREKLCKYIDDEDEGFMAQVLMIPHDILVEYVNSSNKEEDEKLIDLCLEQENVYNIDIHEVAKKYHRYFRNKSKEDIEGTFLDVKFDELGQEQKNYYYNKINNCIMAIKNNM